MPVSKTKLGVYVHIPFCTTACPYCNFNFRLRRNFSAAFVDEYVQALLLEWGAWQEKKVPLASLYFGGGTPSLLSPEQIALLVERIAGDSHRQIEVTLEANPEDLAVHLTRLGEFRQAGINRLSLGVQTFEENMLKRLGRCHTPRQVREVVEAARKSAFENISCDLMGALPDQNISMLEKDLQAMIDLSIDHVSYYGLTIEEKTPFYQQHREGKLTCPDEDTQAEMFGLIEAKLQKAGFLHYEISNYARCGFESQHNLGYWNFCDYAGLGAGAHSFESKQKGSYRSMNLQEPNAYVNAIRDRKPVKKMMEEIHGRQAMGEFLFTGLRQLRGIPVARFQEVFGEALEIFYAKELKILFEEGMLQIEGVGERKIIKLTPHGVLLADSVFEHFI